MTEKLQTERETLPLWDRAAFKDPFGSSYIIKSQQKKKKKNHFWDSHIYIGTSYRKCHKLFMASVKHTIRETGKNIIFNFIEEHLYGFIFPPNCHFF